MTRKKGQTLKPGDKVFVIKTYGAKKAIPVTVVAIRSKYIYVSEYPEINHIQDLIKNPRPIQYFCYMPHYLRCENFKSIEKTKCDVELHLARWDVKAAQYQIGRCKGDIAVLTNKLQTLNNDLKAQEKILVLKQETLSKKTKCR